jgi:hypothetical protein
LLHFVRNDASEKRHCDRETTEAIFPGQYWSNSLKDPEASSGKGVLTEGQ